MPNHVKNRVRIYVGIAEITPYLTEERIDFEKIIPTPLSVYRHGVGAVARSLFGENTWYDWAPKNWGTKWNAYDVEPPQEDESRRVVTLVFETAWNAPHPVILALSHLLKARIEHSWACEGGCTWGHVTYGDQGAIVSADIEGKLHTGDRGMVDGEPTPWLPVAMELWGAERFSHEEEGA